VLIVIDNRSDSIQGWRAFASKPVDQARPSISSAQSLDEPNVGDEFFEGCEVRTGLGSRCMRVKRMNDEEVVPIDDSLNGGADSGVCPEQKGRGQRRASMQLGRKG
jgi:hypothetical protein